MPGDVLGCHWLFPMPGVNPPRPSSPQPTFIHVTVSYMYELLSTKASRDSSPFSLHMAHNSQSPSFCLLPEGPIPVTFQWCVLTSKAVSNSLQFLPGALKPGSSYFQSRSQSLGFQLSKWAKSRLLCLQRRDHPLEPGFLNPEWLEPQGFVPCPSPAGVLNALSQASHPQSDGAP